MFWGHISRHLIAALATTIFYCCYSVVYLPQKLSALITIIMIVPALAIPAGLATAFCSFLLGARVSGIAAYMSQATFGGLVTGLFVWWNYHVGGAIEEPGDNPFYFLLGASPGMLHGLSHRFLQVNTHQ